MCVLVCLCVCVSVLVFVCVYVVCFKMLKGIHVQTQQLFDELNAHYYYLSTLFLVWRSGLCSDHGHPLLGV